MTVDALVIDALAQENAELRAAVAAADAEAAVYREMLSVVMERRSAAYAKWLRKQQLTRRYP